MKSHSCVARVGGLIFGLWTLFAGAGLLNSHTALADSEPDSSLVAGEQSEPDSALIADNKMEGEHDAGGQKREKCKDPIPCAVNTPPKSTDTDMNGTACPTTGGNACKVKNAPCGPGARVDGKCQTHMVSGLCQCQCIY